MKYVSLTFDDGRKDNYSYAHSILQRYKIGATLFCTTGFVDGTFTKPDDWKSAGDPLSIQELQKLSDEGWEIALHGDQHITDVRDCLISIEKIQKMGINKMAFGFSLPNSEIPYDTFSRFKQELFPTKLTYIRCGRAINTNKLSSKLLFALYTVIGIQKAYNRFNKKSIIDINKCELCNLPSVVIRCKDNPKMVLEFLESIPDNTWVIFMLHSILPKTSSLYGADPWNWSTDDFESFVMGISKMKGISARPVSEVLDLIFEDKGDCCGKNGK